MPTSQSASLRERAACSRFWSCSPGRSFSKPSRIACFVIDEIQRRSTGFGPPSLGEAPNTDSYRYAKINSPSRPASQALMIRSTSSSADARSRPTEGFSAMTSVLAIENTLASVSGPAGPVDTCPCAAEPLLSLRGRGQLADHPLAVPPSCRGCRKSAEKRRIRPGCEPHVEFRPLAVGGAALASTVPQVHGEVGALLVAPGPDHQRRRRLSGQAG